MAKPTNTPIIISAGISLEQDQGMEEELQQTYIGKTACGGKLKEASDFPSAIYRGERIYFCAGACLRAFERDPGPFMAGEIEHPIHAEEEGG